MNFLHLQKKLDPGILRQKLEFRLVIAKNYYLLPIIPAISDPDL